MAQIRTTIQVNGGVDLQTSDITVFGEGFITEVRIAAGGTFSALLSGVEGDGCSQWGVVPLDAGSQECSITGIGNLDGDTLDSDATPLDAVGGIDIGEGLWSGGSPDIGETKQVAFEITNNAGGVEAHLAIFGARA